MAKLNPLISLFHAQCKIVKQFKYSDLHSDLHNTTVTTNFLKIHISNGTESPKKRVKGYFDF